MPAASRVRRVRRIVVVATASHPPPPQRLSPARPRVAVLSATIGVVVGGARTPHTSSEGDRQARPGRRPHQDAHALHLPGLSRVRAGEDPSLASYPPACLGHTLPSRMADNVRIIANASSLLVGVMTAKRAVQNGRRRPAHVIDSGPPPLISVPPFATRIVGAPPSRRRPPPGPPRARVRSPRARRRLAPHSSRSRSCARACSRRTTRRS